MDEMNKQFAFGWRTPVRKEKIGVNAMKWGRSPSGDHADPHWEGGCHFLRRSALSHSPMAVRRALTCSWVLVGILLTSLAVGGRFFWSATISSFFLAPRRVLGASSTTIARKVTITEPAPIVSSCKLLVQVRSS